MFRFERRVGGAIKALVLGVFILLTALWVLHSSDARAEGKQDQIWNSVKVSNDFAESFHSVGELLHRYSQDSEEFVTRSVRFGVGYTFTNQLTYTLIAENRMTTSDPKDEIRFIHQFGRKWPFDAFNLALRGRWEQREFSDTPSVSNRLRARVKADAPAYKFWVFTPFALAEYFYAINDVPGRPEGADELRLQLGAAFKALGGKVSLSYLDRSRTTPSFEGNPKTEQSYGIVDLSVKWSF